LGVVVLRGSSNVRHGEDATRRRQQVRVPQFPRGRNKKKSPAMPLGRTRAINSLDTTDKKRKESGGGGRSEARKGGIARSVNEKQARNKSSGPKMAGAKLMRENTY